MDDRVFFLRGDIVGSTADVVERFAWVHAGKPIMMDIDSPGGYVDDAERIHRALRNHGKAIAYASGRCLSAAMLVLTGCAVRAGSKGSQYMLHRSWRQDDLQGKSHDSRVASHRLGIHIAKALGKKPDQVMAWIDGKGSDGGETRWDADQAFKAGLLHCRGVQAGPEHMSAGSRLLMLSRELTRAPSASRKRENLAELSRIVRTLPKLSGGDLVRYHHSKMARLLAGMPSGMVIG